MIKRNTPVGWIALVAGLVLINFIASRLHSRVDLTEEKRYSLTTTTKNLLQGLPNDITVSVFLKGDLPVEFRKLANSTQEFLSIVKESNPSKVHYRFIDPQDEADAGVSWADSLKSLGASPINLSVQVKAGEENKIAFPYAIIQSNDQLDLVNLFQSSKRNISVSELNNAEAMLEYQFAKTIDKINNPRRPSIVYASGNGEPSQGEVYDLVQTLSSVYDFHTFNLSEQPYIPGPDTISAMLIVKPSIPFNESEKLKIDQYAMRGGKVLWFIDNLQAEQDSLSIKSQVIAYDRNLNIQDILFNYGIRINPDLIMDLLCDFLPFAVGGCASDPQFVFFHWNYYPLFESRNNHDITKNLGLVAGRFVNSLDTIETPGIKKTFLLQSSANSRTISTPALISPNENRNAPQDVLFKQHDVPAAVLLEGRFPSLYKGRIGQVRADSLAQFGGFRQESDSNAKMIVVADGDIVLNDATSKGPLPMGMNLYTLNTQYEYQFANRDFLLNCLEYMTGNSSIIQTRNKEIVLRLLDTKKVEAEKSRWQLVNIALPIILIIIFGFIFQQVRRYRYTGKG
jgi:gliding-associated putative ABC transporter substrate-binding component GldG